MKGNAKQILEIGSGKNYYKAKSGEKVVHLDQVRLPHVEVIHDLNKTPYPFQDNHFDIVVANHVLEHLEDLIGTMTELHRITREGGLLKIKAPYFSSPDAIQDPTHKYYLTFNSFDYFDKETTIGKEYGHEVGLSKYHIINKGLIFTPRIRFMIGKLIFQSFPLFYEALVSRVIPAKELLVDLKVIK